MEAKTVNSRIYELKNNKEPYMKTLEKISEYLLPFRELLFKYRGGKTEDKNQAYSVYDGSPISALNYMVDGMYGYMCPSNMVWFRPRARNSLLNSRRDVKMWLEETTWGLLMALERSNFYHEITKFLADGIGLGTAYMYIYDNPRTGQVIFRAMHPYPCYIASDQYGNVDTFGRKYKMSARQIVQKFGEKADLPDDILRSFRESPYDKYELNLLISPREDRTEKFPVPQNFDYSSYYSFDGNDKFLKEEGFYDLPVIVWKYREDSEEEYGRGIGHDALYDILGINQMSKTMIDAGNRAVRPPLNVPMEMKGKVRNIPGGVNYYEDEGRLVFPTATGINYPIGVDQYDRKKEVVHKHFNMDFWLFLSSQQGQAKTATEIIELQGEKVALLSANIGRFEDSLDAMLSRVLSIEMAAGRITPPPPALSQDEELSIDFLGPLSQAVRRLFKGQGINRTLSQVVPLFQIKPDVMDTINFDETVRELMDANGMPEKILNSRQEVKRTRQAKAAMMQQQQGVEQAEAASKLPIEKKGEPGSILETLSEQVNERQ